MEKNMGSILASKFAPENETNRYTVEENSFMRKHLVLQTFSYFLFLFCMALEWLEQVKW